jgi:hypothetical protein
VVLIPAQIHALKFAVTVTTTSKNVMMETISNMMDATLPVLSRMVSTLLQALRMLPIM